MEKQELPRFNLKDLQADSKLLGKFIREDSFIKYKQEGRRAILFSLRKGQDWTMITLMQVSLSIILNLCSLCHLWLGQICPLPLRICLGPSEPTLKCSFPLDFCYLKVMKACVFVMMWVAI